MNKRMINGFFSNKEFFLAVGIFAGLFALVALAYLFADDGTGSHTKNIKGFFCKPDHGTCEGGVRVFVTETNNLTDGCKKSFFTGKCSGTCYWCEPSDNIGSYCEESEKHNCVALIQQSTLSCGEMRPHACKNDGGHGLEGCCPEKDMSIQPEGICEGITHCVDTEPRK